MNSASPIFATIVAARKEGLAAEAIERRVWERHGTTCALLALDSSGMTRFTREHGIVEFLTRYMEMRELAVPVLRQHGCLAWRCFADNLFGEFTTVDAALAAAREVHRVVRSSGLKIAGSEPYRVCIGIGYGRVLDDGSGGKMGDEMNIVAKLGEDVAEAGETILSESAYACLTDPAALAAARMKVRLGRVEVTCYRVCD
jgi:adenylate cyclase